MNVKVKTAEGPALDRQLREAVRGVMEADHVKDDDLAKVQEVLDRKAALARASLSQKVRRIRETA